MRYCQKQRLRCRARGAGAKPKTPLALNRSPMVIRYNINSDENSPNGHVKKEPYLGLVRLELQLERLPHKSKVPPDASAQLR